MDTKKRVALVAHDNMKRDLAEWVDWNWEKLLQHHLICTGTARCGCEGIAASGYALQRADGDQPFLGRLPDLVAPVRRRLRSCCKGLQGLRGTHVERSRTKVTCLPACKRSDASQERVVIFCPLRICVFQTGSSRGKVFLGAVWPCIVARFEVLLCTVRCGVLPYAVLCCAGFSGLFSGHAIGCRGYVGRL